MSTPLPRVSAKKYQSPPPAVEPSSPTPALIRMRIKGHPDGPIYQGQHLRTPCATCRPTPS